MHVEDMSLLEARNWLAHLQGFIPRPGPYSASREQRLQDIQNLKAHIGNLEDIYRGER